MDTSKKNFQSITFCLRCYFYSTQGAPKPTAPLNPAVQINYILYLSGQLGVDPITRQFVSDDVGNQTQQIFHNIQAVLHAAGSNLNQIAQCLVLLADINDYQTMNQIYGSFFSSSENYPARTTFAVKSLPANAKIEIQCTAYTKWSSQDRTLLNCYSRLNISFSFILFNLVFYTLF